MGCENNWSKAGLIFLGYRRIDPIDAASRTAGALKALGERVTTVRSHSEKQTRIETARHRFRLTLCEDVVVPTLHVPADVVLRIEIQPLNAAVAAHGRGLPNDTVLARVVKALHDHLRPEHVQWIEEQAVLSTSDFVMATTQPDGPVEQEVKTSARVRPSLPPLPEIEEIHASLDYRLERTPPPEPPKVELPFENVDGALDGIIEDMPDFKQLKIESIRDDNDKLRLSAWFLSIAVACIVLPLGVALMIINLVKGENLRLASQTAALSGLFVSFHANGATAQALQTVQNVLN